MSHECSKGDIASYTSPRLQVHAHVNGEESKLSQKIGLCRKKRKKFDSFKKTRNEIRDRTCIYFATQC